MTLRKPLLIFCVVVAVLLAACETAQPTPPPSQQGFTFQLSAATLTLKQGQSQDLTLSVTRQGGFADAITLTLENAPSGVRGNGLVAQSGTNGAITLSADAGAALVSGADVTVVASAGSHVQRQAFKLTVTAADAGEPSTAYVVTGLVSDAQGNPVANADINLRNALVGIGDVRTKTGPDGRYRVNVPEGSWLAEANRVVDYHNVEYCLAARPNNTEAIWARDGGVRDFVFLVQGENPRGGEPYGGELEIEPSFAQNLEHGSTQTIILTVTPDGPLIDGSTGQTISGPVEFKYENFSTNIFHLYDIPFGRYRVSAAWQQPNGNLVPLKVRNRSSSSPSFDTNIIQFDGGFLGCGSKYYNLIDLTIDHTTPPPTGEPDHLSGTLNAPDGHTVAGSLVIACQLQGDNCDDAKTFVTHITQNDTTAPFVLGDLADGNYFLFAWKDLNANSSIDPGDLVAVHAANGEIALVTPPAQNLALSLAVYTDDSGNAPDPSSISGSVSVPSGQSVQDTVVVACFVEGGGCNETRSAAVQLQGSGTSGAYTMGDLGSNSYMVAAWKDLNGNGGVDAGDLFGFYVDTTGTLASVTAPTQGVNVALSVIPERAAVSVPSELVGTWTYGSSTGVDYYNPGAGSWAPTSGSGALLRIGADGSFTRSLMMQISTYSCTSTAFGHYEGFLVATGRSVTLNPERSRQKYISTCNPSLNVDHDIPNAPLSFDWRLEDNGSVLVLVFPDGQESRYHRD